MGAVTITKDFDVACVDLIKAMNGVPGIRTSESCCGHGRTPYHIWFYARSLKALPNLLYWFDGCHCGFYGWRVLAKTDCGKSPVHFLVEGPVGEDAYYQSLEIARLIEDGDE